MTQYASMIRKLKTAPVMESLIHLYGNRDGMLGCPDRPLYQSAQAA